jgi:hypothetical protein
MNKAKSKDDHQPAWRSLSAGSLSLVVHAVAFLLLAWIVQPQRAVSQPEPEHTVQIVLTHTDRLDSRTRYTDRSDAAVEPARGQNDSPPQAAAASAESVPSLAQVEQLIPRELALPANQALSGASAVGLPDGKRFTVSNRGARIPIAGNVDALIADEQARLRASRPAGEPTTVTLFNGAPSVGRSFIFLIDRSKSMGHAGLGALEVAEAELLVALRHLQPTHKFQVIAYHHQCVYLEARTAADDGNRVRRELLPATGENLQAVKGFLSSLAAFGATEHERALQSALGHAPDVIYLLTDGGDPHLSEAQIRNITRLARGKTAIHCIQFGLGPVSEDDSFLRRLAALNQGEYGYVDLSRAKN